MCRVVGGSCVGFVVVDNCGLSQLVDQYVSPRVCWLVLQPRRVEAIHIPAEHDVGKACEA